MKLISERVEKNATALLAYKETVGSIGSAVLTMWMTEDGFPVSALEVDGLPGLMIGAIATITGFVGVVGYVADNDLFVVTGVSTAVSDKPYLAFRDAAETLQIIGEHACKKLRIQ